MNSKYLSLASLLIAFASLGICIWMKITAPRIAYVRSAEVVDGYAGMKEARNVYQQRIDKWLAGMDTLDTQYSQAVAKYEKEYTRLTAFEKEKLGASLNQKRADMEKYQASVEQKAKEEEAKIIQGALNQINSFVKQYAETHGYQVVLGTTQSGNVLYATDAIDITQEVLQGLNNQYRK